MILILNNSQDFLSYIAVCPYLITPEASFRKSILERKISTAVKIQYRPAQRIRSHEPRQQSSNISYGIRVLFAEWRSKLITSQNTGKLGQAPCLQRVEGEHGPLPPWHQRAGPPPSTHLPVNQRLSPGPGWARPDDHPASHMQADTCASNLGMDFPVP